MKRIAAMIGALMAAMHLASPAGARAVADIDAVQFERSDGRTVSLRSFAGRPVLVEVWASWCAPCLPALSDLERIGRHFGSRELAIVPLSVDRGGAPAALRAYAGLGLARFPLYLGDAETIASAFGARALPTTIVYDRKGREVARFSAERRPSVRTLVAAVRRAMAQSKGPNS